ncbi:MAG: alanine racemase [Candidatus Eremiobacteraeota bacterium]|nr:alanine racemase [Candidatus Eremiobacteraeota bacterium]MBV8364935.1 alanine racemase [Candidatus Eremiobacteraeota bacterium]
MKQPQFDLDLDVLRHNVRSWLGYLAGRELWAVVKSNAYGLGLLRVANACVEAGAQRLCVVDMSEALQLREAGIKIPIVHVWATPPGELEIAVKNDVIVTLEDLSNAKDLSRIAIRLGKIAVAHVAVETGTGWSGIPSNKGAAFADAVRALPGVRWEGAWTHIASREQMLSQLDLFYNAVDAMRASGLPVPMDHVAATAPTLWGVGGQAARIGIGLYGSHPGGPIRGLPVRTAVTLRATVLYAKQFEQATSLGYGGTSIAKAGECIVTLRLGYADGLPRSLAVGGQIKLQNERCPIVGAIGMNFTMIRVPYGVTVRPGDEALVLGDVDGIRLDEVAQRAGTIPHQLITSLSALSARPSV